MKKIFSVILAAIFLGTLFASVSSAYYSYPGDNDYTRRTYHSTYERNGNFRSTDYDRFTSTRYVDNQIIRTTSYTRTTREIPDYYSPRYAPVSYQNYDSYYNPWYRKYWDDRYYQPSYFAPSSSYRTYYRFSY